MSELIDFAARLIELEGGAVEFGADGLTALLPDALCRSWLVGEELVLSEAEGPSQPLAYGSALLERMLESATGAITVTSARLESPELRGSQVKAAAERWSLRNGVVSVAEVRLGTATRYQLFALATLHGDEKREQIVSSVLSAASETEVPGFADAVIGSPFAVRDVPSEPTESALAYAMRACQKQAERQAQVFREGMTRRFERDRERIEVYFQDLSRELDKRAKKGSLDPAAVLDKRNALLADRAAKLESLSSRFVLRIELLPIALRILEVDAAFAVVTLRRRKATRAITLEYDAATRRLVAPRCDGCGGGAQKPAACDDALHLLCEACAPRAEGRVACAACRPRARFPEQAARADQPSPSGI